MRTPIFSYTDSYINILTRLINSIHTGNITRYKYIKTAYIIDDILHIIKNDYGIELLLYIISSVCNFGPISEQIKHELLCKGAVLTKVVNL